MKIEFIQKIIDKIRRKPNFNQMLYSKLEGLKNFDEIKVTRFIPTAKAKLGFMQDITPRLKLKFHAGVAYEMGYKDDFNGAYINGGFDESIEMTDLEHAA